MKAWALMSCLGGAGHGAFTLCGWTDLTHAAVEEEETQALRKHVTPPENLT